MRLLLIRHGKAGDRQAWQNSGKNDVDRPLTRTGRDQMKEAARTLSRRIPRIDLLATSPLVRASQTARIVFSAYEDQPQFIELDLLSGGRSAAELLNWLTIQAANFAVVAIVGHEPDISHWAAFLLCGQERPGMIKARKGSTLVIDFPDGIEPGKATLNAMVLT